MCPLGNGGRHGYLIDTTLQWIGFHFPERRGADDEQCRNGIHVGTRHRRDGVGEAGPGRHYTDAKASLGRTRVRICCMTSGSFVTEVDEPDALIRAGHEKRIQVPAMEGENVPHTQGGQRPGDQRASGILFSHLISPSKQPFPSDTLSTPGGDCYIRIEYTRGSPCAST